MMRSTMCHGGKSQMVVLAGVLELLVPAVARAHELDAIAPAKPAPPAAAPPAAAPPAAQAPSEPSLPVSENPSVEAIPGPETPVEGAGPSPEDGGPPSESTEPAPSTEGVDPQDTPERQQAAALFMKGTEAYELGQYETAAALFEQAWRLAPEPAMLFNLGQAHWRWFDVDPKIDHLRQARTFFQNYDKRMQGTEDYFPAEVNAFIIALNTQIQAEEQKEAERNRPIVSGPTVAELEAKERRELRRAKNLRMATRFNAVGIAFIVVGSLALATGLAGLITRSANKLILENTSGSDDPNTPNISTQEEDERRRNAYLIGGQVAYAGFVSGAVFLPVGIGFRLSGGVIERRELGRRRRSGEDDADLAPPLTDPKPEPQPKNVSFRPGALLTIEF